MAVRKRNKSDASSGSNRGSPTKHHQQQQAASAAGSGSPYVNGKAIKGSRTKAHSSSSSLSSASANWILALPWTAFFFSLAFFTLGILTPLLVNPATLAGNSSITSTGLSDSSTNNGGSDTTSTSSSPDGDDNVVLDTNTPLSCEDDDEGDEGVAGGDLSQFLHDEAQRGVHVVCVTETDQGQVRLRFYKNSHRDEIIDSPPVELLSPVPWSNLKMIFKSKLGLKTTIDTQQQHPWVVYSGRGDRVVSEHEDEGEAGRVSHLMSSRHGIVLIFEDGVFRLPGNEL